MQWTLWAIVMSLVMTWIARSRTKPSTAIEAYTMRHPVSTLVIGLIGLFFFGSITILSNTVGKNESTSIWTTLVFLFFALLSLLVLADYLFARHHIRPDGLDCGRMFWRREFIPWRDIQNVHYSESMKWFTLRTVSGAAVRFSALLIGLPHFAQQLLNHLPPDRIDEPTQKVLKDAANGILPRVWN